MLLQPGLTEGKDYETVQLDGFDPKVHIATPDIVGFDGYKSNEPLQLAAAGIPFKLYDPSDVRHPRQLRRDLHQRARSSTSTRPPPRTSCGRRCKGLADAIADPDAAAADRRRQLINANGNPLSLSPEGETARWECRVEARRRVDGQRPSRSACPTRCCWRRRSTTYGDDRRVRRDHPDYSQTVDHDDGQVACTTTTAQVIWPAG